VLARSDGPDDVTVTVQLPAAMAAALAPYRG
jgi:hypothetical protein